MMSEAAKEKGVSDPSALETTVEERQSYLARAVSQRPESCLAGRLDEVGLRPDEFFDLLVNEVQPMEEKEEQEKKEAEKKAAKTTTTTEAKGLPSSSSSAAGPPSSSAAEGGGGDTFNDAIQQTINRMKESGDKATAAAAEGDETDDLLAELLKAVESGEEGDWDVTKLISRMMEQLSNKEMLYEPMKDLQAKFGPWIDANKDKISQGELSRYQTQANYVSQIVAKFDGPGYSDADPKCREYIWERMQSVCDDTKRFPLLSFFPSFSNEYSALLDASRR